MENLSGGCSCSCGHRVWPSVSIDGIPDKVVDDHHYQSLVLTILMSIIWIWILPKLLDTRWYFFFWWTSVYWKSILHKYFAFAHHNLGLTDMHKPSSLSLSYGNKSITKETNPSFGPFYNMSVHMHCTLLLYILKYKI